MAQYLLSGRKLGICTQTLKLTSIQLSTRAADGLKNFSDKYFHVRAAYGLKRLNFERYNVILKNVAQLKLAVSKSINRTRLQTLLPKCFRSFSWN
jgi:hypothetical protein